MDPREEEYLDYDDVEIEGEKNADAADGAVAKTK
jgi:hypothetical protein